MMKQFFVFALIFGIALGMPEKLSEKEFEEKFNELVDPILEEKAGEELAKEELKIARITVMNFIFFTSFVVSVIYLNSDISLEDINNA